MKRYVVFDSKKGTRHEYSEFQWNLAWVVIALIGFIGGLLW